MSVVNHEWERIPQQLILKQSHKHMRKSIINSKFEWLKKYLEQSSNLRKSSLMKQGNHLKHTSFLKQRQNVT